jgi:hypothetical protein
MKIWIPLPHFRHFPQDLHLYTYCANDPVNWIDPWGWCKRKPWWRRAKELSDEAEERWPSDSQDWEKHVWVCWRLTIEYGPLEAFAAGLGKEIKDAWDRCWGRDATPPWRDLESDWEGISDGLEEWRRRRKNRGLSDPQDFFRDHY